MNPSLLDEIRHFFTRGSVLARLIGINIAIFVVVALVRVIFFLADASSAYDEIIHWFGVPSFSESLLRRPWTLFSYMFLHFDFFHIFFNMIMLYIGGRLFREFLGDNRMTGTYIIGGLMGALFFILAYNIFPVFQQVRTAAVAIGASASVLAIFVAIATYMPNYPLPLIILGRIRLKYIALFFILIDLISIDKGNSGGHLAHLGGALWGFMYIGLLKQGMDPGKAVGDFLKIIAGVFRPHPRMKVHHNNKQQAQRPLTDEEYNKRRVQKQKHMDAILDKISKHGYDSLTAQEKETLFRLSNKE